MKREANGRSAMLGTTRTPPTHPATMVAVEAMLLGPRDGGGPNLTDETGLWPVFAVVLDDPNALTEPSVRPLFELLDEHEHTGRIAVVACHCQWAVIDRGRTILQLAVHAIAPVRFDVTILLPTESVPALLDLLARGTTIALTNRRHASRLTDRVRMRDALAELVLLSAPPSPELATLASASRPAVRAAPVGS